MANILSDILIIIDFYFFDILPVSDILLILKLIIINDIFIISDILFCLLCTYYQRHFYHH